MLDFLKPFPDHSPLLSTGTALLAGQFSYLYKSMIFRSNLPISSNDPAITFEAVWLIMLSPAYCSDSDKQVKFQAIL